MSRGSQLKGNQHARRHGAFSASRPEDVTSIAYDLGQTARQAIKDKDAKEVHRLARAFKAIGHQPAAVAMRHVARTLEDETQELPTMRRPRLTPAAVDALAAIAAGTYPTSTDRRKAGR